MKVKCISFMLEKNYKDSLKEYFEIYFEISNRVNIKILLEKFVLLNQLTMTNV